MKQVAYEYQNLSIPGGGFVTGFLYHPMDGTLYCRTDIGGCYRYIRDTKNGEMPACNSVAVGEYKKQLPSWKSLIDHSDFQGVHKMETFPLSIAINSKKPEELYVACGDGKNGCLAVSRSKGEYFEEYFPIPARIHGNHSGRGSGERLAVDGNAPEVIYFGSQEDGLLRSTDGGRSWESVQIGKVSEKEITFVYLDERFRTEDGRTARIIVATTGECNATDEKTRGQGLYISNDGGANFTALDEIKQEKNPVSNVNGYVGIRLATDEKYYYISFTSAGPHGWCSFSNYTPDSNDSFDGKVIRYRLGMDGTVEEMTDITPQEAKAATPEGTSGIGCGFGGVAVSKDVPGLLLVATLNRNWGDMVLRSEDYGATWCVELDHADREKYHVTVPYLKPDYNGTVMPLHWLTSLEINPLNPDEALFNTGTGVFMTHNLQSDHAVWETECYGIEETVHLNLYSPPAGDAILIDIVGDLGGFVFRDTEILPENSFADADGNRYITCMNADFPDADPDKLVVCARGNWTGMTKGGVIYSKDQGRSFDRLPMPYGISEEIDKLLTEIERPNVNPGWCAISADAATIVWTVGNHNALPANAVVYTEDEGAHWTKSRVYDLAGQEITDQDIYPFLDKENTQGYVAFWRYQEGIRGLKVMADRVNPRVFYGLGDASKCYLSTDGAKSFYQIPVEAYADGKAVEFPILGLAGVDMSYHGEVRVESDKEGVMWLAMEEGGLWKLCFDANSKKVVANRVTKEGDVVLTQGMGKGLELPDGSCPCKTLFVGGTIAGEYGFFRSFDEGKSWERINSEQQMYGELKYMTGDPRRFGRVYIATGTRGLFWGDPV